MARLQMATVPNVVVDLEYNETTLKVSAMVVTNNRTSTIGAKVVLTNGNIFSQNFPVGSTSVNLPNNVVSLNFFTDPETGSQEVSIIGVRSITLGGSY